MKPAAVLRREWFGGLEVTLPDGRLSFMEADSFHQRQAELATGQTPASNVRVIDATRWGYPLLHDALSTPAGAYLELTYRCDAACTHCYANAGKGRWEDELSLQDIERLLHQLAEAGAYEIRLTGGEPTLRSDLPEILDIISETGMKVSLNTHGCYGENMLRRLLDKGVKDLRISIDGTEAVNDAIRGKGRYQAVLATLRRVASYNRTSDRPVDTTINVTLMTANRRCVRPLIELAGELGTRISFGLLRPAGRADVAQMLAPEDVVRVAMETEQARQSLGLTKRQVRINYDIFCESDLEPWRKPFPFDNSKCPIGTMSLGVTAAGRVVPCNYLALVDNGRWVGEDVRGRNVLDLWHHSEVLKLARQVRRSACADCRYHRTKCNGGCPATAVVLKGGLDAADPYCVRDIADARFPELPSPRAN